MNIKPKTTEQEFFRIKQEKRRENRDILRTIETTAKSGNGYIVFLLSKIQRDRKTFV